MASKHQLTGMTGVYLVAAELSKRGFIVSPTSRSAQGADLLVTDTECKRSFAVQVKTNSKIFNFFLLNSKAKTLKSKNLIYAFVNLRKERTEYYLVPSAFVAKSVHISKPSKTRESTWHSIQLTKIEKYQDNWQIFNVC
jgi:hypothetical protein